MIRTSRLGSLRALLIIITAAGCGAATVKPTYESTNYGAPRPNMVLVYRFAINGDEVTLNQGFFSRIDRSMGSASLTQDEQQTARKAAQRLADDLVKGIQGLGLQAQLATVDQTAVPPNSAMISGAFIDIDEGNRTRQMVIGFGVGKADINARMRLATWNGSGETVLATFDTHVDSGEMPGAAVTMGAGAAAQGGVTAGMAVANAGVSGVKAYRSADDPMIDRMAEKMVVTLSQYFGSQGWIPPNKVKTSTWSGL
jgi:hypothetical protein